MGGSAEPHSIAPAWPARTCSCLANLSGRAYAAIAASPATSASAGTPSGSTSVIHPWSFPAALGTERT
jgi:hypothetical protein